MMASVVDVCGRHVHRSGGFEGTATEILTALTDEVGVNTARLKTWPKAANSMSSRVRRAATFLRHGGINIDFDRKSGSGKRIIAIRQIESAEDRHNRHDRHGDLSCDDHDDRDDRLHPQSMDDEVVVA